MLPAMVLLAAVLPVPAFDAAQVLPQKLEFDVVREGAVVGQHRITFHQEGGKLLVHSELAIQVKVCSSPPTDTSRPARRSGGTAS
jgi:hypothetical protein